MLGDTIYIDIDIVWAAGVVCGGVSCVMWHAGDMEGAQVAVDVGDMGVWLSCLVFTWLSWFVGSQGCSWWLWDEEGWRVTICGACDLGSMFEHAHMRSCSHPNV